MIPKTFLPTISKNGLDKMFSKNEYSKLISLMEYEKKVIVDTIIMMGHKKSFSELTDGIRQKFSVSFNEQSFCPVGIKIIPTGWFKFEFYHTIADGIYTPTPFCEYVIDSNMLGNPINAKRYAEYVDVHLDDTFVLYNDALMMWEQSLKALSERVETMTMCEEMKYMSKIHIFFVPKDSKVPYAFCKYGRLWERV